MNTIDKIMELADNYASAGYGAFGRDDRAALRAAITEALDMPLEWRLVDGASGLKPVLTQEQYEAQKPAVQRFYQPVRAVTEALDMGEPVAWRRRYDSLDEWEYTKQPAPQWAADHSRFEEQPLYAAKDAK